MPRACNNAKSSKLVPPLLSWFSVNARDLPWRRTHNPYAVWVSEIMLQQTQVKTVLPYWTRWMRELPTIRSAAKAPPAKLHKLWEGLGYYTRVRNLQKAAKQIIAQHGGQFPENFDDILALPGIGRYTAGAIASIAFNEPRPILDGNIIRVLTRVFGIATDPREKKTNAKLWQLAYELAHHASRITHHASPCSHLNQSLMELGALICKPRAPKCDACPIIELCVARRRGWQERIPPANRRAQTSSHRFLAFVVEKNGKFLVRQRSAGRVNAHLWEFPNVEILGGPAPLPADSENRRFSPPTEMLALPVCDFRLSSATPLCVIKHSITRYRITLEAYRAKLINPRKGAPVSALVRNGRRAGAAPGRRLALHDRWLTLPQLHKLAFTSAHKKILNRIESERRSPNRRVAKLPPPRAG